MPGELPPATQYTYAVEFSVDQADAAGATGVEFSTPLINYVENFADVPVGNGMPSGAYDRATGRWIAAPDGRVIAITAETGGLAEIDLDGKSGADTAQALHAFGISDDERRVLADLYAPGAQLMRMLVPHFSPWDHNSGMGIPPGARVPRRQDFVWKDPNDPCKNSLFSEIACERQTVIERIPIAGTPYELAYTNDRQPGWQADSKLSAAHHRRPGPRSRRPDRGDRRCRRPARRERHLVRSRRSVGITFQTECAGAARSGRQPRAADRVGRTRRLRAARPGPSRTPPSGSPTTTRASPTAARTRRRHHSAAPPTDSASRCAVSAASCPAPTTSSLGGNGDDSARRNRRRPTACSAWTVTSQAHARHARRPELARPRRLDRFSPVHALDTVDSTVFRGDGDDLARRGARPARDARRRLGLLQRRRRQLPRGGGQARQRGQTSTT